MKTSTIFTRFSLTFVLALFVIFQSCKKNDVAEVAAPASENDDIVSLQQSVAASNGLSADKVEYLENEKEFLIDGDAIVSLEDAKARFSFNGTAGAANGATHKRSPYIVAATKVNAIKIYCDATVPAVWVAAMDSAIRNWNASGSKVYIQRITTSTGSTTRITTTYNSATTTVATAQYPSYYGNPGSRITINTYYNAMAVAKKVFAITHELGHTIGLTHTNGTYGSLITGTPTTDLYSVMNAVCQYWKGFSAYDLKAVRTVYPK